MNAEQIRAVLPVVFRDPAAAAQVIMGWNPVMMVRWMLLVAVILCGVLLAYVLPVVMGSTADVPPPLVMAAIQIAINVAAMGLITGVGRLFGGQGRFDDTVLLMAAFQGAMLLLQVAQLIVALILPGLGFLVAVFTVGLFFWILTGFICALHGFRSQILVLLGVFATVITASFIVATLALMMGIQVPGVTDV